ncbi:enoyl-CoA hydratase/isomerase family protein [Labedaea rhizosphaerae]|uniref:Enoyl-CoA hydratase/carnithine racemase n=1 Tax=Labedaea rhizosphaerae TaxID=598644 RepID=A0A4R6RXS5_LABRH|nr:enoyl-CoA hydratase/isomerase family protein [Labedaea rhizosphaerae]TDP91881.1 enoyl-CoA hydratase/carnithine racemase [Labedaea rhizosphaerae]
MPLVRWEVREPGIGYVTLDSPSTRNALGDELLDQLLDVLECARTDDSVRVVVLGSSHDRVFSAGGDLKAFAGEVSPVQRHTGLDRFPRLFALLGELGKPVVCAAGGDVLAGAFGLALACDLVVARRGVRFGCPEINVGVFPFMISALIDRTIGRLKANELMMLGELIDADEALRLGLVNIVVDAEDFDATVLAWARRLAAKSPLLMRMGKDALAATRDLPRRDALDTLRGRLALALTTEDIVEGVNAFRDKRAPNWSMR